MSVEDLRARFGLPRGASSAALERALRQMRDGDDDRATTTARAMNAPANARASDGETAALRRECETLRRENRALRHARVRATVRATASTTRRAREETRADASTATRDDGDDARALERIAALEARLKTAREEMRALEDREKELRGALGKAEAIADAEAEEKLALRKRLTETLGERAALKVECETQRETIESMRANERRLRDDALELEKRLARAASTRETYRKTARALEASERESAERGERLALVEAECVMLAEMVREMNKLSGVDPREFMAVAERALLGADVAPVAPSSERSPSPAASDDGYATPDEDDFPSPPISGIVQRGTPDSAGSTAFNF
jgi:chromosome segregation ATPase